MRGRNCEPKVHAHPLVYNISTNMYKNSVATAVGGHKTEV